MNPTLTNALTVAALFGGALAFVTTLAAIEIAWRGLRDWWVGRGVDGREL